MLLKVGTMSYNWSTIGRCSEMWQWAWTLLYRPSAGCSKFSGREAARSSRLDDARGGADNNRLAGLLVRLQQVQPQLIDRCTAVLWHCGERRKLLTALQQRLNRPRFNAGIIQRSDPVADHFLATQRWRAGACKLRPLPVDPPPLQHLLGQPSRHLLHHLS